MSLAVCSGDDDEWEGTHAAKIAWAPCEILKSYYLDDLETK